MSALELNSRTQSRLQLNLRSWVVNSGRGIALFLAVFSLLNLGGELIHPGFDASGWWIDIRGIPRLASRILISAFAVFMFEFARKPDSSRTMMRCQSLVVLVAILVAARDSLTFFTLLSRGTITTQFPLPFSLIVMTVLFYLLLAMQVQSATALHIAGRKTMIAAATLICMIAFPLLQIHCFGCTDYRRPADAAVVFGCKVYPSGKLSPALADRVRSACDLHHQGLVEHLVMSGGPGQGSIHETEAMRDYAISLGIPGKQILIDRSGLSTEDTVTNTVPLFRKHRFERILAVSHFFHLPRIKLAYQRAGLNVFTVPARQNFRLPNERFMLFRETVALWAYYARPLTGL